MPLDTTKSSCALKENKETLEHLQLTAISCARHVNSKVGSGNCSPRWVKKFRPAFPEDTAERVRVDGFRGGSQNLMKLANRCCSSTLLAVTMP